MLTDTLLSLLVRHLIQPSREFDEFIMIQPQGLQTGEQTKVFIQGVQLVVAQI